MEDIDKQGRELRWRRESEMKESSIYIPSENVREKLRNNTDDPLYLPLQDNAELNKGKMYIHYFRIL